MKTILLTQGKVALVDDEDYERLNRYQWHYVTRDQRRYPDSGYACRRIRLPNGKRKVVRMHREILSVSDGFEPDHNDGNTLNNSKSNLRNALKSQQNHNRKKFSNNTSGHKGVHFHVKISKFVARIGFKRKRIHIGYFNTAHEAALAYAAKAKELFGQFSRTV